MLCQIEKLRKEDLYKVKDLLKETELPYEDFDKHSESFLTAKVNNELIGAVGLEIRNENALLRSLVVKEKYRGYGFGKELYEKCIVMAKHNFIQILGLLTTTAEDFFAQRGFVKVTGNNIPQFIKETKEFQVYCPDSSIIMIKKIEESL